MPIDVSVIKRALERYKSDTGYLRMWYPLPEIGELTDFIVKQPANVGELTAGEEMKLMRILCKREDWESPRASTVLFKTLADALPANLHQASRLLFENRALNDTNYKLIRCRPEQAVIIAQCILLIGNAFTLDNYIYALDFDSLRVSFDCLKKLRDNNLLNEVIFITFNKVSHRQEMLEALFMIANCCEMATLSPYFSELEHPDYFFKNLLLLDEISGILITQENVLAIMHHSQLGIVLNNALLQIYSRAGQNGSSCLSSFSIAKFIDQIKSSTPPTDAFAQTPQSHPETFFHQPPARLDKREPVSSNFLA